MPILCGDCRERLSRCAGESETLELHADHEILQAAQQYAYRPGDASVLVVPLERLPTLVGVPDGRCIFYPSRGSCGGQWYPAAQTYETLRELAATPLSGVSMVPVLVLSTSPFSLAYPFWSGCACGFRWLDPEDLPAPFVDGFIFETPVVIVTTCRAYLEHCGQELVHVIAG